MVHMVEICSFNDRTNTQEACPLIQTMMLQETKRMYDNYLGFLVPLTHIKDLTV